MTWYDSNEPFTRDLLIKTLGDAGLVAFDAGDSEVGVRSLLRVKGIGDQWLSENGMSGNSGYLW